MTIPCRCLAAFLVIRLVPDEVRRFRVISDGEQNERNALNAPHQEETRGHHQTDKISPNVLTNGSITP
jgi:hypothetical protein